MSDKHKPAFAERVISLIKVIVAAYIVAIDVYVDAGLVGGKGRILAACLFQIFT